MDHGAAPWLRPSQGRPDAGMDHWRGMYPQGVPHQFRNSKYGYYPQPHARNGQPPWPAPWTDYYSQHATAAPMYENWGRPASQIEMTERSDTIPYRPLSRQGYDERYVFSQNTGWGNNTNADHYYGHSRAMPREEEWLRETQRKHTEQWAHISHTDSQNWIQGYGDSWVLRQEQDRDVQDKPESQSSTAPSLLSQYRDSGMSSSSYELSQYMQDSDPWNTRQGEEISECTPQPTAPFKFSLPHVTVCFGARGHLVRVCPNFPDEGQPALVEIHSLEVLLHDTVEQGEMRNFPGPVQREDLHKVDIIKFCQQNVSQCLKMQENRSRDEALLWQILLQMCRQNGCIAGSDVAELLLEDCKMERYHREEQGANLISLSEDPQLIPGCFQADLLTGETPSATETYAKSVEKFTKLLFFGRKKEALDWAMKAQMWGHALFLSSKMDPRTYSWVMGRFTSTLAQNDPLQTLFQFMAGRIPQAATSCGDPKWGDWRPHLAVILSNPAGDSETNQRSVITMGDNLVLKGSIEAGHCCYLTAGIAYGHKREYSDHIVLLGSSHNETFQKFASSQSIQRTEILEYCQCLRTSMHCIPSFQVYKLLYAARLMDYGLTSLALHYCECIASAVLAHSGSVVLISELIKLSDRLRYSDPRLLDKPELEQSLDPEWLSQLRVLLRQLQLNASATRLTPVNESTQDNKVVDADPVNRSAVYPNEEMAYPNSEVENLEAEAEYGLQSTPQFQATEPNEVPNYSLDVSQPVLSVEVPQHNCTHEQEHQQESTAMESLSQSVCQSSYIHNSNLSVQCPSGRIRTVSESSTVSMEEDNGEEQTEDQAVSKESIDRKKGSSFGWFGWFRSKPSKESAIPAKVSETKPEVSPNAASLSALQPPLTKSNLFSRGTGLKGIEEPQNNNSNSVLSENQGHLENMMSQTHPSSVPEWQTNQPSGAVPLYNPWQFPLDRQTVNNPKRLIQRRYPVQPQ
ncbi:protein transport protein Sec16B [Xenopus laevis]|uniref:Sec16 Sec23-binding domain-containing protein n=2 Tax=Xenopus laevis TaxID=8355 RepID=A0A974HNX2_XENLA|nr:protein transport protein Sec16B [Xenopus laevis]OCT85082.1 hypothetical protein XELAEV_18023245mg [Xenopus laevis]